jgi:4'-phosphopantetheinyl transferase
MPSKSTHSADVWFQFTGELTEFEIASARAILSPVERHRCDRFASYRDRQTFAAAHALLRSALSLHEDSRPADSWLFQTASHGKPCLVPGQAELAFSLAHTVGLVACALANIESIGMDVESLERIVDTHGVATRYFSQREILALEECEDPGRHTRFIELWTLKEAYLKATGAGLSTPLNGFGFELQGESELQFNPPDTTTAGEWYFGLFAPSPRYRLAVAVRAVEPFEFRVRSWPPGSTVSELMPLRLSRGGAPA